VKRIARATALVLALAATAVGVGPATPAAAAGTSVVAYFDSAISVYEHGDVKILGLSAGKVTKVVPEGKRVRIELSIDDGIPVPTDVQATIIPSSLIGERYVQLFPAWTEGKQQASGRLVIPQERTSVPVEPDEALAALKKLLDALDPDATGRLIKNLGDDLDGQGKNLSTAIKGLSELTRTLADKSDQIVGIIDNVDRLTTTLRTRETQLASIIDSFAKTADLLAREREQLQALLTGLADVSVDAYTLIRDNRSNLQADISTVSRLLQAVSANLDSVKSLLEAGPLVVAGPNLDGKAGIIGAYNPRYHEIDLRTSFSPLVAAGLGQILAALGVPGQTICLPVDVTCAPASGGAQAQAVSRPVAATPPAARPKTPITGVLDLLGAGPGTGAGQAHAATSGVPHRRPSGPLAWARRTAHHVVEVVG
jgi:phospholipid/cholesterol/gamma-HCH transport system substrate-binding protein